MKPVTRGFFVGLFLFCFTLQTASALSLQVKDGDLRTVLTSLAELSGSNIILDDSVQGQITLEIDGIEAAAAFDLISRLKDLVCERRFGAVIVGTKSAMEKNFSALHVFPVHFADWEAVSAVLNLSLGQAGFDEKMQNNKSSIKTDGTKDLKESPAQKRQFFMDKTANQVVFYGTEAEAATAAKAIELIDVPGKQVTLEAKVIAIQKDAAKKLGVEWEWSKVPQYPDYTTDYEAVKHIVENKDGTYTNVTEDLPKTRVQRSWKSGGGIPGILQFGHGPEGHPFEFYYAAELNALVSDGKANILARPNIMTIQGREAVINIGGEVPVPTVATTNATTTTSIEYREAGIILRYTPRVNDDGYITAAVHTEVSSPLYVEELKAYRFQKRSADTTVRLKNGETMVIGGLIGSEEARSSSKIPFLGDLPILGRFFRNEKNSKTDSEIMIFLTAHVVE